ncbi:MAG: hypothetical protein IJK63_00525 [Oscillospiraceae bacterium]|nr:hypothetical protein [Oscillospiraceae bacterium]
MNEKRSAPPAKPNSRRSTGQTYSAEAIVAAVFAAVKENCLTEDVVREYGFEPNRAGFIRCPFHGERTPSLKLYRDRWHCFGCGEGGDVIDFVSHLFSLSPLDACRRLNADFHLGLEFDRPPTPAERDKEQRRRRAREAERLFTEWRDQMLLQLDGAIRVANLADFTRLSDAETLALRWREPFEEWADVLSHGPLSEQMGIFRKREEVQRLCAKILSPSSTRSSAA